MHIPSRVLHHYETQGKTFMPIRMIGRLMTTSLLLLTVGLLTATRPADAQVFADLHDFAVNPDAAKPYSDLCLASDGTYYGTAYYGGDSNNGAVFKVTLDGVVTILHEFTGSEGSNPASSLIQDTDGGLLGMTY
jgi:uncharacterized repeat protein (TIGR03803 family)